MIPIWQHLGHQPTRRAEHSQIPERKPGEPCPLCTHESSDWNLRLSGLIELGLGDVPQQNITAERIEKARAKRMKNPVARSNRTLGCPRGLNTRALHRKLVEEHAALMRARSRTLQQREIRMSRKLSDVPVDEAG